MFTLVIFMKVDNISSLLMFVLTFVLFFNLIHSSDFHEGS